MRKWSDLLLSNFFGVFNDNFLKNAVIFIAVGWNLPSWLTQSQLISIVSASLIVPYLILSPLGGKLSVKYSRLKVFHFFKLIEFPIMFFAIIAFVYEWVILAVISVLLMGIQSCLYSPAKYGLIRDIGGIEGSAFGSGLFETMAFLGILMGTVIASLVSDHYQTWLLSILFLLFAAGGYYFAKRIRAGEQVPDEALSLKIHLSPFKFLADSYRLAKLFPGVNAAVFGVSVFWLIGALLQMNIIIHAKIFYLATNTATGIVMACAAVGIAVGTWLAGTFARRIKRRKLIVLGLSGMMLCLLPVLFLKIDFVSFAVLMFLTAGFGGLFQVPNLTTIQQADAGRRLGQLLAYMNLMIFVFVLIASLIFSGITYFFNDNSVAVFFVIISVCLGVFICQMPGIAAEKNRRE